MFITPKKNPSKNSSCGLMKKHIIPWIMVGPELQIWNKALEI